MERPDAAGAATQDSGPPWRAPPTTTAGRYPRATTSCFSPRSLPLRNKRSSSAGSKRIVPGPPRRPRCGWSTSTDQLRRRPSGPGRADHRAPRHAGDPGSCRSGCVASGQPCGRSIGSLAGRDRHGDPRRPRPSVQRWLAATRPARESSMGRSAPVLARATLEAPHRCGRNGTSFPHFLILQGVLSPNGPRPHCRGRNTRCPGWCERTWPPAHGSRPA